MWSGQAAQSLTLRPFHHGRLLRSLPDPDFIQPHRKAVHRLQLLTHTPYTIPVLKKLSKQKMTSALAGLGAVVEGALIWLRSRKAAERQTQKPQMSTVEQHGWGWTAAGV